MRNKFLIGGIVVGILLLAAIFFLLPPAPGEPGANAGTESVAPADPFALIGEGELPAAPDESEYTPAQIAAFEKMHAEMPGNIFLPILPGETDRKRVEERDAELLRMRAIHFKIEKDRADPAERERYYDFRIQYNKDKAAMLRYIAVKTPGPDGSPALPAHIQQMIDELERENDTFAGQR